MSVEIRIKIRFCKVNYGKKTVKIGVNYLLFIAIWDGKISQFGFLIYITDVPMRTGIEAYIRERSNIQKPTV